MTREYTLAPSLDAIGEARSHVRDQLSGTAFAALVAEVELVVSELVTNAVRYGPGEPIVLRLVTDSRGGVCGEVEDQGDGVVAIREQELGSAIGGLGLPIVDRLASAWGVYPGSTHVWFRFDAAA